VQLLLASCNKRQQLGQTFENSLMAAVGSKDLWPGSRKPVMKMLTYHKHQRAGNRSIVMATAAGQPHNPDQQSQPESQQTFDQPVNNDIFKGNKHGSQCPQRSRAGEDARLEITSVLNVVFSPFINLSS